MCSKFCVQYVKNVECVQYVQCVSMFGVLHSMLRMFTVLYVQCAQYVECKKCVQYAQCVKYVCIISMYRSTRGLGSDSSVLVLLKSPWNHPLTPGVDPRG